MIVDIYSCLVVYVSLTQSDIDMLLHHGNEDNGVGQGPAKLCSKQ